MGQNWHPPPKIDLFVSGDVASGKALFQAKVEDVRVIAHLAATKQFITPPNANSPPHLWGERGSDDGKAFEAAERYTLMALSADQQMIAFAGGPGCDALIMETGGARRVVARLSDRTLPVWPPIDLCSITFSNDGKLLIGGGVDQKLRFWEIKTGKLARTLDYAPDDWPLAIAVSPDGRRLFAGGGKRSTLFDLPTGQPLAAIPRIARKNSCVAFIGDGARLICGEGFNPELWNVIDPAKPKRLATFWDPACYANALAISPDGRYLAAAGGWGTYILGHFSSDGFDISLWEIPGRHP